LSDLLQSNLVRLLCGSLIDLDYDFVQVKVIKGDVGCTTAG